VLVVEYTEWRGGGEVSEDDDGMVWQVLRREV